MFPKTPAPGTPRRFGLPHPAAIASLILAAVLLSGCSLWDSITGSSEDNKDAEYVERPVEQIYDDAWKKIGDRDWLEAAKQFDEVERQHPYSIWATKAELMAAYSMYQANNYQDAINALDRFIELHPGNRDIAYAYYLRALCYYEQVTDVERDQSNGEKALSSLDDLIKRYPESTYARDARHKIDLVRDHLAGKELEIGRYYETRGLYLAAINRFKVVVDKYQTTSQVPEALHRLVECYMALGIVEEARKTAAVLGYNYPRSEWYVDSYELVQNVKVDRAKGTESPNDNSFLGRTLNALSFF